MADETKTIPEEIRFFFEHDKDYRIIATNGVWGGITPIGDIQLDFYVERMDTPESILNKITEDGKLGDEISRQPEKRIIRRLQIGVLMSIENAEVLANFLKEKISDMKKIKG